MRDLLKLFLTGPILEYNTCDDEIQEVKDLFKRIYTDSEDKKKFTFHSRESKYYTHAFLQILLFCCPQKCFFSRTTTSCLNDGPDATPISIEAFGELGVSQQKNPVTVQSLKFGSWMFYSCVTEGHLLPELADIFLESPQYRLLPLGVRSSKAVQSLHKLIINSVKEELEGIKIKLKHLQDLSERFFNLPLLKSHASKVEEIQGLFKRLYTTSSDCLATSQVQHFYTHSFLQLLLFSLPQYCVISFETAKCFNDGANATAISLDQAKPMIKSRCNPVTRQYLQTETGHFLRHLAGITNIEMRKFAEFRLDPVIEDISKGLTNTEILPEDVVSSNAVQEVVQALRAQLSEKKTLAWTSFINDKNTGHNLDQGL